MLLQHSVAGSACKQPVQRTLTRAHVIPTHACMSMRQAGTSQAIISSSQRLQLASPALRPGRSARRPVVQTRAFFDKIFKQDPSEKTRKQYQERVDAINALEPLMQSLSDDQLRAKTQEFKQRVARGETLESLLPEAFAVSAQEQAWCALLLHNCCQALASTQGPAWGAVADAGPVSYKGHGCVPSGMWSVVIFAQVSPLAVLRLYPVHCTAFVSWSVGSRREGV